MGSVWGHRRSVWSQTGRTHECLSLDYMPGTVLGSVGLTILLSDSIGQVSPAEFQGCSLTQAEFFSEGLGTARLLKAAPLSLLKPPDRSHLFSGLTSKR